MRSMVEGQVRRCITSQAQGDAARAPPPPSVVPLPVPGRIYFTRATGAKLLRCSGLAP